MSVVLQAANRFDDMFKHFATVFTPMKDLFDFTKHVYCFVYDRVTKTARFEAYYAEQENDAKLKKIEFGHDLMYEDRIWFYYDPNNNYDNLEAGVSYSEEYRPVLYVNLERPIIHFKPTVIPRIAGITQ